MDKEKKKGNQIIQDSFDDFIKDEKDDIITEKWKENNEKEVKTIEERFNNERIEWTRKIHDMSFKLKKIFEIQELLTEIYTERQRALEYYHYLITLMTKVNISYRKYYSQKYEYYSFSAQKRFPNESTKNNQILSEMKEIISKKEALGNHAEFMKDTTKTIDNLIFGIKYRIEIEQISRGK